jgi:hypothetical protein
MMRVPDGSITEGKLVGEENRLTRRALTIEQVFADLHRVLGHSAGTTKTARVADLASSLEIGQSTLSNTLCRVVPVGDILLVALYGDEPANALHPDWAAEPEDWGPITPWGAAGAPVAAAPAQIQAETPLSEIPNSVAAPAAPAPPPPLAPVAPVVDQPVTTEPEAVRPTPPPAVKPTASPIDAPAPAPPAIDANAIAEKVTPLLHNPVAAAVDLLRDQRELAQAATEAAARSLTLAREQWESLAAHQGRIETAIEVLEGLSA